MTALPCESSPDEFTAGGCVEPSSGEGEAPLLGSVDSPRQKNTQRGLAPISAARPNS